jgi:hypothetical protein
MFPSEPNNKAGLCSRFLAKQTLFHHAAQNMNDSAVGGLNNRRIPQGDGQIDVHHGRDDSAIPTQQTNRNAADFFAGLQSIEDIFGIAAGGDADKLTATDASGTLWHPGDNSFSGRVHMAWVPADSICSSLSRSVARGIGNAKDRDGGPAQAAAI